MVVGYKRHLRERSGMHIAFVVRVSGSRAARHNSRRFIQLHEKVNSYRSYEGCNVH